MQILTILSIILYYIQSYYKLSLKLQNINIFEIKSDNFYQTKNGRVVKLTTTVQIIYISLCQNN